MNYCALGLICLYFFTLYSANDNTMLEKVCIEDPYTMPLISSDGHVLQVPDFLISYSPVLTNAWNFPSQKHSSFGFSISALCLLLRLLYFESQHAKKIFPIYAMIYQGFKYNNYSMYNNALEKATSRFKELFFTPTIHAYAFELAHFFCLGTIMLCIANIGTTPHLSNRIITRVMERYKQSQQFYPCLYLEMLRQRLAERDCAARHLYIYENRIDPFFKGLTVSDLILLGVFSMRHAHQNPRRLMLNKMLLYSLHGIDRIPYAYSCNTLSLAQNYFRHISDYIQIFKNVVSLDLTNNYLTSAQFVKHLPQLRSLTLAHNHIKNFSHKIQQLQYLEKLDLSRNRLTTVSIKKGMLNNLTHLTLHTNYISNFKKEANSLKNIVQIDLGINRLSLPPIEKFEHMQELFLDINQIASMPIMDSLLNVQRLTLADNNIAHIDPNIGRLKRLEALDLSDNILTEITPLAQLKNLVVLILKRNKITTTHAQDFFNLLTPGKDRLEAPLQQLRFLDMSYNPVKEKKVNRMCATVNKHRHIGQHIYITDLAKLVTKG